MSDEIRTPVEALKTEIQFLKDQLKSAAEIIKKQLMEIERLEKENKLLGSCMDKMRVDHSKEIKEIWIPLVDDALSLSWT